MRNLKAYMNGNDRVWGYKENIKHLKYIYKKRSIKTLAKSYKVSSVKVLKKISKS